MSLLSQVHSSTVNTPAMLRPTSGVEDTTTQPQGTIIFLDFFCTVLIIERTLGFVNQCTSFIQRAAELI